MLTLQHVSRTARWFTATLILTLQIPAVAADKEDDLLAILKGDAAAAEKAMACKRLAVYGSKAAVPELAKFLSNPQLASWARIALEAIPGTEADEALRKSTESLEGNLLIGSINSIGVRRDAAAVELLTTRLKDKDTEVATAAAVALGHVGNDAAAKSLRDALASVTGQALGGVAEGAILCAERQLADNKAETATAIYDEVRKADVPRQRKIEATRGAILARKQDGLPLLVEQLRADDSGMFQIALSTAREISSSDVDKALAAELDRAAPERAALIISVIADRPDGANLPAVLKAAGSGPKPVRLAALTAISRIGNPSCLSTLFEAAADADAEIVEAAQLALSELPGDGVNEEILSRLPKAQGKTQLLLIETIGQRRIQAVPALVTALDSSDKSVRAASLKALGNTVTPKNLNVLITQVVTSKQADDRPVALQALKTAAVRMPDRDACVTELAAAMTKANGPTKDELLEIISEVGGAKSLQTIGAAAKSNDPQLQDTGSRLLGKWASVDAAPVLLDLAKTASSDKYHVRAVKGYISLARRFATLPEAQRLEICRNALDVARYPADKKLVLDVLKLYPTVESLKLAIKAREIAEIKDDAADAARAIAPKVKGDPAPVKEIMAKAGLDK
ncbi:MAG TPA: HEAT repeat domain-containing protein [Planctomycetaceae bacterium]|nr:HEAT repeat domain-containing protein [Planctomycetaceae bacterium]